MPSFPRPRGDHEDHIRSCEGDPESFSHSGASAPSPPRGDRGGGPRLHRQCRADPDGDSVAPRPFSCSRPHDRTLASCNGKARRGPSMEPRHLGARPRSRHPSEFTSFGPHRGKSSVSGNEGGREFGDGRGALASTDAEKRLGQSARPVNHPVRHSPSASTSRRLKPRRAADPDTPSHSSSVIPLRINHPPGLSAPAKLSRSGTRTPA